MASKTNSSKPGLLSALSLELQELIKTALPSTVTIKGYSTDLADDSQGSGWIYDSDFVVTNNHVIEGMQDPLTVQHVGRASLQGVVIGRDPDNDIAVLKVDQLNGIPLDIEDQLPSLGEFCVAIGSPLAYRESASFGIVSGLSRQIRNSNGTVIEEMSQTDAPVNHGNSGGPLINMAGKLLGMNTMGPRETVNMAVPAETLAAIVPELINHGSVQRASLGISIALKHLDAHDETSTAICVKKVRDSGTSPFKEDDILRTINGRSIHRRIDVIRALNRDVIGRSVEVVVERDGQSLTLQTTPTAWAPAERQAIQ